MFLAYLTRPHCADVPLQMTGRQTHNELQRSVISGADKQIADPKLGRFQCQLQQGTVLRSVGTVRCGENSLAQADQSYSCLISP